MTPAPQTLQRRLGLLDAVVIGMGSMIGAGVFAVWTPALQAAGGWLVLALAVALVVAYCNASSSAQLAAQYPTSGGTYVYGRERLGEWPGFLAGWGFVIGKTASVAAMALTFAAYVVPGWEPPVAVAAVVVLTLVNLRGVTRTARATRVILAVVLPVLAVVCVLAARGPRQGWGGIGPGGPIGFDALGVLQAAGLLFFAFAGYARVATMGEEVRDPKRTIPRAILVALGLTALVYAAVALLVVPLLRTAGPLTPAPLADAVHLSGPHWLVPVVGAAAALATAGAMLNLMTGIGRTTLAMARNGDLPRFLAQVEERRTVPRNAELVLALVVCALVLVGDVRSVIGFSSFGVLLYYLVANLAALTQDRDHRRFPKALQVVGAVLCVVLVVTLPWTSIAAGIAVYAVGAALRLARRAARSDG
ncbi:APC family permease [Mariniluteicoccus endophyticus]